ncbi:hypothetical protein HY636_03535 [Candidatus Woesearchaeota archaeon]|nr:hypothetical protein [Candidatus Woesearchaeota archaeon]
MQRKRLWLPRECLSRPVEYLKGGKGYNALRAQGEITRFIFNLATYALRPYHFDNIADFLGNQKELEQGIPLVFPELEVKAARRYKEIARLELILGDNSGALIAIYDWTPRIEHDPGAGNLDMAIDPYNNPLFGAKTGDTLRIFSAMYEAQDTIRLDLFRVLNDKHYQRIKEMRAKACKEHGIG